MLGLMSITFYNIRCSIYVTADPYQKDNSLRKCEELQNKHNAELRRADPGTKVTG